eukprot:scaffold8323_cov116-Isochrysis_galbana.AAC.4
MKATFFSHSPSSAHVRHATAPAVSTHPPMPPAPLPPERGTASRHKPSLDDPSGERGPPGGPSSSRSSSGRESDTSTASSARSAGRSCAGEKSKLPLSTARAARLKQVWRRAPGSVTSGRVERRPRRSTAAKSRPSSRARERTLAYAWPAERAGGRRSRSTPHLRRQATGGEGSG